MIILDSIIFSLQKAGGISVVWHELIRGLLKSNLEFKCIEYGEMKNINRDNISIPKSLIMRRNHKFLCFKRYLNLRIDNIHDEFIFHSSYYRTCSNKNAINITTVHDFTYEYYYSGIKKWIHCWQKHSAIRKSDYIICISESTKNDLLKFLPEIDSRKIRVIYNGVSNDYFPIENINYSLPFDQFTFALFVGGRDDYKQFNLAVKALKNTNIKLVIIGKALTKKEIIFLNKELGVDSYKSINYASSEFLNILYNTAYCLLYLSMYEGFGIPVLEAQKAGCPVIAYNTSSIPEIIGETPLLLSKLDEGSVVECLNKLNNLDVRNKIIKDGMKNCLRFSWDKMYDETILLYKDICKNTRTR